MKENECYEKLRTIALAMRRFETSAAQMKRMGLDHAYWTGREEAIADLRAEADWLDEFEKEEKENDGEIPGTADTAASANPDAASSARTDRAGTGAGRP
jgi:hypothetical protein